MAENDTDQEKEKRSKVLTLRLHEWEMKSIHDEAKRRHMKVADYCRFAMTALIGGGLERKAREYFKMTVARQQQESGDA
jgi:hypothetical protein